MISFGHYLGSIFYFPYILRKAVLRNWLSGLVWIDSGSVELGSRMDIINPRVLVQMRWSKTTYPWINNYGEQVTKIW